MWLQAQPETAKLKWSCMACSCQLWRLCEWDEPLQPNSQR